MVHSVPFGSAPSLEWQLIGLLTAVFALVWLSSLPIAAVAEVIGRRRRLRK